MLRGDQPERQRQEPGLFLVRRRGERAVGDLREQDPELGQVVGADEAVLVEEVAVRRDVGEQLDHESRHLHARGIEVVEQRRRHAAGRRTPGWRAGSPAGTRAARRPEQQVLRDADVRVVARRDRRARRTTPGPPLARDRGFAPAPRGPSPRPTDAPADPMRSRGRSRSTSCSISTRRSTASAAVG